MLITTVIRKTLPVNEHLFVDELEFNGIATRVVMYHNMQVSTFRSKMRMELRDGYIREIKDLPIKDGLDLALDQWGKIRMRISLPIAAEYEHVLTFIIESVV